MVVDSLADIVAFKAVCLQRSLALQWLMRRRGVDAILHYGIEISAKLKAHVWVNSNGDPLIGAPQNETFTEVTRFPQSPSTYLRKPTG